MYSCCDRCFSDQCSIYTVAVAVRGVLMIMHDDFSVHFLEQIPEQGWQFLGFEVLVLLFRFRPKNMYSCSNIKIRLLTKI